MQNILLYLVALTTLMGCNKEFVDEVSTSDEVRISSSIATRVSDSQWDEEDKIGVYMTSSSDDSSLGDNIMYETTNGNGNFTSDNPLYYPASSSVDLFAYYPYVSGVNLSEYPIDSQNQIDLLSAETDSAIKSSSSPVKLTFNHLLSKVSLTIEAGDGLADADLGNLLVKLSYISTTATFDIENKKVVDDSLGEIDELGLTTATNGKSSSAIVIPQSLKGAMLYFTTEDCGTFSATLSTEKFEVGKEYKYAATLNRDGVVLSEANIDSWDTNTDSGTADIVDIELKSDGKYYINSAAGLKAFADLVNGVVNTTAVTYGDITFSADPQAGIDGVLTRDIDLESMEWTPIGDTALASDDSSLRYSGVFDGAGYEVKNLNVNSSSFSSGLFGYCVDSEIRNVGVSGSVSGSYFAAGGLVGWSEGTIDNCYSSVNMSTSDTSGVGGIAGISTGESVTNCYNSGEISGSGSWCNVGGVVGSGSGTIIYCYNSGNINGSNIAAAGGVAGSTSATIINCENIGKIVVAGSDLGIGGVVGYNGGSIINCNNNGELSGTGAYIGGVVGWNVGGSSIKNCYNTGSLNSTSSYVGGVAGDSYGTITSCYWNSNIYDGKGVGIGSGDVASFTTIEMQALSFVTLLNNNAYTYNNENPDDPQACAWVYNKGGNPTFDFGGIPIYTIDIAYNDDTYEIYTTNGLWTFADLVNGSGSNTKSAITSGDSEYFDFTQTNTSIKGQLMDDIDLESNEWTPIGDSSNQYLGTFDGGGYLIEGLNVAGYECAGLFGCISSGAEISNLGVDGSVNGDTSGGVVGYNQGGTLTNCYNMGSVSGVWEIGGVVGFSSDGIVVNCYNMGSVSDGVTMGGVVGWIFGGTITNCYNTGRVSDATRVGSVAGYNDGTISNCYWNSETSNTSSGIGEGGDDDPTTLMSITKMQDADFATKLIYNATLYNSSIASTNTQACSWMQVSEDSSYPTLNFGVYPPKANANK